MKYTIIYLLVHKTFCSCKKLTDKNSGSLDIFVTFASKIYIFSEKIDTYNNPKILRLALSTTSVLSEVR